MDNTLVVAEDIDDYGALHDEDNRVLPLAMQDRNPYHPTSSSKPPSSRPSWKTKKVVLGLIMGLTAVVVVARANLFFSGPPAARTGPESSLLQHYPYVKITNKTPYDVRPIGYQGNDKWYTRENFVSYPGCESDFFWIHGLSAGATWTAYSRGLCLVNRISATLTFPNPANPPVTAQNDFVPGGSVYNKGRGWVTLTCTPYTSTGTSFSIYSILMKGDDACCVLSSHEIQKCPAIVGGMPEF